MDPDVRGTGVCIEPMKATDVLAVTEMEGPTRMTESSLREEMLRPWSRSWVAREGDGSVVAFLLAWHVADELHVLNVATRADRRRRGIGRALLSAGVGYARRCNIRQLLLEVRRSNRSAVALYRQMGFFATGVRARYYSDDEDAVEMVLTLDPQTGEIVRHPDEVKLDS
jgi:[ribosomal protein S18]-alanine N-acetyltransferase